MSYVHPRAAVLSIGDELLIGQVVNSNAAWMGAALTDKGFRVMRHLSVGDDEDAIAAALDQCLSDAEVVVICGGLGPTDDDLTLRSVARHLKRGLRVDQNWVAHIEKFFRSRGREMAPSNVRQGEVPEGAELLPNPSGTAPGIWVELTTEDATGPAHAGKVLALTPGVPYEMMEIMEQEILPRLAPRAKGCAIFHRTLHTAGLGESQLAQMISGTRTMLTPSLKLAYLPHFGEVRLRITAEAENSVRAEGDAAPLEFFLRQKLEHHLYGADGDTLELAVIRLLRERKATIAVAESCTGGLINNRFTNVPGSSQILHGGIITYANVVKTAELGVPAELFTTVGAVSEEVARAMAEGVRRKFSATIGLAVTGIAGPDGGTPEKPVGTVWIAVCDGKGTVARKVICEQNRLRNKERFTTAALNSVRLRLLGKLP